MELLREFPILPLVATIVAFQIGLFLQKKTKSAKEKKMKGVMMKKGCAWLFAVVFSDLRFCWDMWNF